MEKTSSHHIAQEPQNNDAPTAAFSFHYRAPGKMLSAELHDKTAVIRINPEIKSLDNSLSFAMDFAKDFKKVIESLPTKPERVVVSLDGITYLGLRPLSIFLEFHVGAQYGRCPAIALCDLLTESSRTGDSSTLPIQKLRQTRLDGVLPIFKDVETAVTTPDWSGVRTKKAG